jgi:hypothetical protein
VQFRADIVLTGPKNNTLSDVLIDNKLATVSKTFDVVAGEEYTYSVILALLERSPRTAGIRHRLPDNADQKITRVPEPESVGRGLI